MPEQTKASNPKDMLAEQENRVHLALIPQTALVHEAMALMDGARKYGAYNWRSEGVGVMTYVSAAMRHIADFLDGETVSQDANVHHLGHARACLGIILDGFAVGNIVDDRPPAAPTADMMESVKRGRAVEPVWEPCIECGNRVECTCDSEYQTGEMAESVKRGGVPGRPVQDEAEVDWKDSLVCTCGSAPDPGSMHDPLCELTLLNDYLSGECRMRDLRTGDRFLFANRMFRVLKCHPDLIECGRLDSRSYDPPGDVAFARTNQGVYRF